MSEAGTKTEKCIAKELSYGAHNYAPLPVVLSRGEGVFVYDVEGTRYFDFLSAYSAVSQGHGHPRILRVLKQQAGRLALVSRAFHSDVLCDYAEFVTQYFGYTSMLPMNTGAEAVETAIKLARKWGYEKKGVPEGEARIVVCSQNFHGRTSTIVSFSSDEVARSGFGPYATGFRVIPYDDTEALEEAVQHPNTVAFLVEPIQGEAGVLVPKEDYLKRALALCEKHKVLLIADEIQTGLARTGALLGSCGSCDCQGRCERKGKHYVRPHVVLLGKALSGGFYPVSLVLCDKEIMEVMTPGSHGSTYGGNPLGCAVAEAALVVLREEKLMEKARPLGEYLRRRMVALVEASPVLAQVRGRGLLNALLINDSSESDTAWRLCLKFKAHGVLAKPTHGNIIRLAPPLVISQEEMSEACDRIAKAVQEFS